MGNVGIGALAERARAGDRTAFAEIYGEYVERICGFCTVLLRDHDEAADATQDVFVLVAQRVPQLRDADRFHACIFAIARYVCYRRVRQRARMQAAEFTADDFVADENPTAELSAAEASDLVWAAAAGLNERDQAILHLNLQEGLEGEDLAAALGVKHANPYSLLHRAKEQFERAVTALLVARVGRSGCDDLATMLRDWDGALTPLLRKRLARHVEGCGNCQHTRARARHLSALGIVPLGIPSAEALRRSMSSDDLIEIASRRPADPDVWLPDGFPPLDEEADDRCRRRAWLWIAAALLAAMLLIGGIAVVGTASPERHREPTPVAVRHGGERGRSAAPKRMQQRTGAINTTTSTGTVATTVPARPVSPMPTLPSTPPTVAVSGEVLVPPHRDPVVTTVPVTTPATTVPHTVPPTTAPKTTTTVPF